MSEQDFQNNFYSSEEDIINNSPIIQQIRYNIIDFLKSKCGDISKHRVLSIGCGTGDNELIAGGIVSEIVGMDLSSVAITKARARAIEKGFDNINFIVGNALEIDLPDKSFDEVWAISFFHHLNDIEISQVLSKCLMLLKPGGLIFSIDPSKDRFVSKFKPIYSYKYEKYHSPNERELDYQSLRDIFNEVGFEKVSVDFFEFFLIPLGWVFPSCPRFLVKYLSLIDNMLLNVKGLRNKADSFALIGRKPL
jgi:ubiquinone/menaquinone biosynthesis C-methylase UbiE